MLAPTTPLATAAGFVLGCIVIHALRVHAERLQAILAVAAVSLTVMLAAVTLLGSRAAHRASAEAAFAFVGFP